MGTNARREPPRDEPLNGRKIGIQCPDCLHKFLVEVAPHNLTQGKGILETGINPETAMVIVQFKDPDWFVEFSPEQARNFAQSLIRKANELNPPCGHLRPTSPPPPKRNWP